MTSTRVELRPITPDTVPTSLEFVYFEPYLKRIDPLELNRIELAFGVATKLHKNHPPRDTGGPYIEHPMMVVRYLLDAGCTDPSTLKGGMLHDGPEDHMELLRALGLTSIPDIRLSPFDLLSRHFGRETAEITRLLTKPDLNNPTPLEKYRVELAYRRELLEHGVTEEEISTHSKARLGKLADRLHNMRTLPWHEDDPVRLASDLIRADRKVRETRYGYGRMFRLVAQEFPVVGGSLFYQLNRDMEAVEQNIRNARL